MKNVRIIRKVFQHKPKLEIIIRLIDVMMVQEDRLGTDDHQNDMDMNIHRT